MEEWVGEIWHNVITRMADRRHPGAVVRLADMRATLGIFFRALGGDGGLQIEAADATANPSYRNWKQRLAGANTKIHLAWRDQRALRLPPEIAWFDSIELNRDLYFWLAAVGACTDERTATEAEWLDHNQQLTQHVLQRFPGLGPRYQRLVKHHLMQRPDPRSLNAIAAEAERDVRQALAYPGSVAKTGLDTKKLHAVP